MIEEWGNGIIAARKVPMIIGQTWSKNWTGRMHGLNFIHWKRCMDTCMCILTRSLSVQFWDLAELLKNTNTKKKIKVAHLWMHFWRFVILPFWPVFWNSLDQFLAHIFFFSTQQSWELLLCKENCMQIVNVRVACNLLLLQMFAVLLLWMWMGHST